VNKEINFKF